MGTSVVLDKVRVRIKRVIVDAIGAALFDWILDFLTIMNISVRENLVPSEKNLPGHLLIIQQVLFLVDRAAWLEISILELEKNGSIKAEERSEIIWCNF